MPTLSPNNPTFAKNTTQDFTPSGFSVAAALLWLKTTFGTVALTGGLIRVTAPNSDGTGTLTATKNYYTDTFSMFSVASSGVATIIKNDSYYTVTHLPKLTQAGDYAEILWNPAAWLGLRILDGAGSNYAYIDNTQVVDHNGSGSVSTSLSADTLRISRDSSNKLVITKNGAPLFTSQFAASNTGGYYLRWDCNPGATVIGATINPAVYSGAGITDYESASQTYTVSAPSDSTPPTDAVLSNPGANADGIGFTITSGTDAESGIYSQVIRRATNPGMTENVTTLEILGGSQAFVDATATPGVQYYYDAKSKNNSSPKLLSVNNSNVVAAKRWNLAPVFTTAANLGNVNINTPTNFNIAFSGGDGTLAITAPDGLTTGFSYANGVVTVSRATTGAASQKLRVTDVNGQFSERTFSVVFSDPNAAPDLSQNYAPNANLIAPVAVQFTDTTAGTLTEIFWDFGDFAASTELSPKHLYLAPGKYKVFRKAKVNGIFRQTIFTIEIGGTASNAGAVVMDEIEINRYYSEGAKGGAEFLTSVMGNPAGNQQRDISRYDPLHKFEISFDGEREDENFEDLLNFFMTRFGGGIAFRFYPFFDNSWKNEQIALVSATTSAYKLIRTYQKAGRAYVRRIIKPVPDLILTINELPAANFSAYAIDYKTGIVTFASPANLPPGGVLRVTGHYCIPVVFETDAMDASGFGGYLSLAGLRVVELLPSAFNLE